MKYTIILICKSGHHPESYYLEGFTNKDKIDEPINSSFRRILVTIPQTEEIELPETIELGKNHPLIKGNI